MKGTKDIFVYIYWNYKLSSICRGLDCTSFKKESKEGFDACQANLSQVGHLMLMKVRMLFAWPNNWPSVGLWPTKRLPMGRQPIMGRRPQQCTQGNQKDQEAKEGKDDEEDGVFFGE